MTTTSPSLRSPDPDPTGDDCSDIFAASAVLQHEDSAARVHAAGDLCPLTAPVLGALLEGLVTDGVRTIAVDLAELRICTSHGLDVIEDARADLAERGGRLTVEHANGVVSRVLDLVGIPHDEP